MDLHGKKILVTGSDGFIGSHLVEELIRRGHDVRAFVLYNSFGSWGWLDSAPRDVHDSLDVFAGDIRDPNGVAVAMEGCDVVLHLAALIAIPYSYHSPDSYVATNVTGTLNVLQAARRWGVERVVQTSTSEVYGTARFVPITEEHPLQGQSPYSATKIGADQMALSFHKSFDTQVTVLRPFNTYGPRQSARAVIPTVLSQIASGRKVIQLGALSPTRDFNYVKDIARAFIAAAESDAAVGEVVNAGSNFEVSIGRMVELAAKALGAQVEVQLDPQRLRPAKSEVDRLWADNTRARDLLGWTPEYGGEDGFVRGLAETAQWFADPCNLAAYKIDRYNL
jgi:NAD dependent epimerase/dehydratase